jgi:hypothetical protein
MPCACGGGCIGCGGDAGAKREKPECASCPNRMHCHGRRTEVTEDTLVRLIADAVIEVLGETQRRRTPREPT